MIILESKAQPIIDLLVDNAADQIREATGIDVDRDDIFYQLCDSDWLFIFSVDGEEDSLDMIQLLKQLDRITERTIKFLLEEQKGEWI